MKFEGPLREGHEMFELKLSHHNGPEIYENKINFDHPEK